jgi:WhiB family redox-sensing transcriptional regulator
MKSRSALTRSPGASGPLLLDDPPWQAAGVCAGVDPDLWFPEKGGSTAQAKRLCRSCPVRSECLEFALDNDERFGIWGGLSERERRRLARAGGPVLRRCRAGLHVLTPENTIGAATCRPCKLAAEQARYRRNQGLAA